MKHYLLTMAGLFLGINLAFTQNFINPDLDGTITGSPGDTADFWYHVPYTDINSIASSSFFDGPDLTDMTNPSPAVGLNGNPYSGPTFISGLISQYDAQNVFHEGIMQTVSGLTPGQTYTVNFYQTVVKQENQLDTSGAWAVYFDNTLAGYSAVSTSQLPFNSNSLVWDYRTVEFVATNSSHTIKFLPYDDDGDITQSLTNEAGGLRMGIDLINLGTAGISVLTNELVTQVSPVPASDHVTISFKNYTNSEHQLLIFNANGGLVYERSGISTEEIQITHDDLGSGIFYFKLKNDQNYLGSGEIVFL